MRSCVKYVRTHIPELPFGNADDFRPNTELDVGVVAILKFPPSERYPNGTQHLAYVDEVWPHAFHIKQTNRVSNTYTEEWVDVNDPKVVGFYLPNIDK